VLEQSVWVPVDAQNASQSAETVGCKNALVKRRNPDTPCLNYCNGKIAITSSYCRATKLFIENIFEYKSFNFHALVTLHTLTVGVLTYQRFSKEFQKFLNIAQQVQLYGQNHLDLRRQHFFIPVLYLACLNIMEIIYYNLIKFLTLFDIL
jgi:hypothetical protein